MWPITITEPGMIAEVLGVQDEVLPDALDVGEVLAQALVAAVGLGAAGEAGGAGEVELAVRARWPDIAVDVTAGEGVVERAHDIGLVGQTGRVSVVVGARHSPRA